MNLQNDNLYSKVEGILFSYPRAKVEIENIKLDIEELNDVIGIRGVSDAPKGSTPTYAITSNVENEVIDRDENLPDKIAHLNRLLRSKERFIKRVENLISLLKDDELQLIKLYYFDGIKAENLAKRYGVETITIYKRKSNIIKYLMKSIQV